MSKQELVKILVAKTFSQRNGNILCRSLIDYMCDYSNQLTVTANNFGGLVCTQSYWDYK